MRLLRFFAATCALSVGPLYSQAPDSVVLLDTVEVRASRLRAGGVPLGRLPYSAQVVKYDELPAPDDLTLADALRGLVGVTTASQFGSELQPDLQFRGFQVGPVVGYPQSVSVFVDGVRVNEPDASQVNFDLIPMHAVQRIEVIRSPGGPFGRNTLAGAINVVTRRGDGAPSGALEIAGGSYTTGDAEGWAAARLRGGFDYLVSGRYLRSDGWRDLNESRIRQLFGKLGYRDESTDLWLSYIFADNYVEGPGSLPSSWLEGELPASLGAVEDPRRLQFTGFEGDYFMPRMHFLTLNGQRQLRDGLRLQGNAFLRTNDFTQFNDNITEANARGETGIYSLGGTMQLELLGPSGMTWTGGIEYARNDVEILIFEVANAAFPDAGGMTEHVETLEHNVGGFAHLWWPLTGRVGVTGSLRYDYVDLPFVDLLDPENNGENTFKQLSGSVGANVVLASALRGFASYGRGFRAPVILELSCADPLDPCPLPFELGADPPLDPVTTDLVQTGLRFASPLARMEVAAYWAEVYDDLFSVIVPPGTRGFFKNLDRTRRQGLELAASIAPWRYLELNANLGLTRATFQTEATLASALADDDDEEGGLPGGPEDEVELDDEAAAVEVVPGDHFAMVPNVTAQLGAEVSPGGWSFELTGSYVGSQYFVGDEDNDEIFGKLDSYFILDGAVARELGAFRMFVLGQNLLNSEFNTFGLISPNVRGPETDPQPFLTPGLPLRVRAGIQYRF